MKDEDDFYELRLLGNLYPEWEIARAKSPYSNSDMHKRAICMAIEWGWKPSYLPLLYDKLYKSNDWDMNSIIWADLPEATEEERFRCRALTDARDFLENKINYKNLGVEIEVVKVDNSTLINENKLILKPNPVRLEKMETNEIWINPEKGENHGEEDN